MKTSRTPKPKLAAWRHDRNLVTFWHHYDKTFVRDGLLYRSLKTKNTHPDSAIVVPKALETEILKGTHDSPFIWHLGVTRTLDRIRKCFVWPNLRKSVENYIRQCDICVKGKTLAMTASNGTAPLQSLQVCEPFTFWALV